MANSLGRKRVVIANVSPQISCGKYPAKGTLGQEFLITADIFSDGHDEVSASILIKEKKDTIWVEHPLTLTNNDHWTYSYYPESLGFHEFRIQGWIDHFRTWKKGFIKKYEAGQDLKVEMQIGIDLIKAALPFATTKEKTQLRKYITQLEKAEPSQEVVLIITHDDLGSLMSRLRDKDLITIQTEIFAFEIESLRASFSTWYELFPRSTSQTPGKHGTFKDVIRLLPRIADMGFDTLYLPPIHPIGELKRKGKNNALEAQPGDPGSPWAIGSRRGGHKSIHPELGSLSDFKDLVKKAKTFGIEIALDIAYQCAPDHPYVKEHPQWFKWRPDRTVQYAENPPKKYEDILPFNFETEDWENLWQELKSIIDYWIDKGITVFRIDNPHTKSFAFWHWMIAEVRAQNPEVIFLAEAFTRPRIMEQLAKAGFNQSYTYFTWRNTKKELEEYITELTKTDLRYYFRPNFWPNTPDILPPELTYGGENAHIRRLILAATLSSNYGLYGPVYEFGLTEPMPGKEEYIDNEKYQIHHWDWNKYTRIKEITTRINKIRKQNTALQSTYNIQILETTNEQILAFLKHDPKSGNTLVIVVNMDNWNTQAATVNVPELTSSNESQFIVRDLLSGDKYQWKTGWNYVQLNPYEMPAHILQLQL